MNFTFGIITHGDSPHINGVINSIIDLKIPDSKFEIIIVGGPDKSSYHKSVKWIGFNENIKSTHNAEKFGWITIKKNLITQNAAFENIVLTHDYYLFDQGWYSGYIKFGEDWDVCMNIIKRLEGDRYRDWAAWSDPTLSQENGVHRICLVPYDYSQTSNLYVSGGYWVAKKSHMLKFPLDENVSQSNSEDVEWSTSWIENSSIKYKMNIHSCNTLLKPSKGLSCIYSTNGTSTQKECPDVWSRKNWETSL